MRFILVKFQLLLLSLFFANSIQSQVDVLNYEQFKAVYTANEDKVYVINFWATWCVPCVKELPYFEEIAETRKDDFEMILVSLDFPKQIESRVIPFLKTKDIKSKVVLLDESDANVFIDDIDPNWSGSIPATLIWYKGKLAFAEREFHNTEELKTFIYKALEKKQ